MYTKTIIISVFLAAICIGFAQAAHVGGLEDEKPADENVRKVISSVSDEIRRRYPNEIDTIEPLSYRTQIVAGMNYFVKAVITDKKGKKAHTHLRIWKTFSGNHELTALRTDVDEKSELKYFQ